MTEPTPEQIEREFTMWRDSEVDRTGTLPTGYELFRAAYELAASAVNGRHDHIEDGSSYLDCIACVAATSRSRPTRMADAVIVDMLTAFYGAERDGWSTKKMTRMRAALVAAAGAAPQEPSEHRATWDGSRWICRVCDLHFWQDDELVEHDRKFAPVQVDEAKLAEVLVRALTYGTGLDAETNNAIAATQASDAAEYLRGDGQ